MTSWIPVSSSRRTLLRGVSKYVTTGSLFQETNTMCPTRCDLDGPGIEFRWGRYFPRLYKPALGPTQHPVQIVAGCLSPWQSDRDVAWLHPPLSCAEVKERVTVHFYSPSRPSVASSRVNMTLWYHVSPSFVSLILPQSPTQAVSHTRAVMAARVANYVCQILLLHRALWNLYIVHSPTNALLLNLGKFKIYIKIHIYIAPTCFGLRPSSGSLAKSLSKVIFLLKHSVKLRRCILCGDVAACCHISTQYTMT